jgi:flavin reductase (DIM6/NTAB) family NADH-FMN oxidoreductase RutF
MVGGNRARVDRVSLVAGNSSGRDIDKFKKFRLTAVPSKKVNAPLIGECYANFECRLADSSLINKYSLFVWEIVKAHAATYPRMRSGFPCTNAVVWLAFQPLQVRKTARPYNAAG